MRITKTGIGVFHSIYYDKNRDWRIKDNIILIYNYLNRHNILTILKENDKITDCSDLYYYQRLKKLVKILSERDKISLVDASKKLKLQVYKNDFSEFYKYGEENEEN